MLEELDYAQVARNIQRQYFQRVAGPGDVSLWSAPWRSGPDRIMPGTDAGSAPQESWHGNSLKPAFAVRKYDPFELATHLQATIVDPQLQDLQGRMKDDASFEDWPAVGKYFDQHILHNSCALAKEGRVPPQALLGLNLHQSFQDAAGNTWMLLPKSTSTALLTNCRQMLSRSLLTWSEPLQTSRSKKHGKTSASIQPMAELTGRARQKCLMIGMSFYQDLWLGSSGSSTTFSSPGKFFG